MYEDDDDDDELDAERRRRAAGTGAGVLGTGAGVVGNAVEGVSDGLEFAGNKLNDGVSFAQGQGQGLYSRIFGGPDAAAAGASSFEFSNNVVTKFVFLIFVLLIFIFFLYLGLNLIGYILKNNTSPYVVYGMVPGNIALVVPQNTAFSNAVRLNRSNNRAAGIEYTWSFWLLVPNNISYNDGLGESSQPKLPYKMYQHVFSVGSQNKLDSYGNVFNMNSIGVYLRKNMFDDKDMTMMVMQDTAMTLASSDKYYSSSGATPSNILFIANLPTMKWMHIAVRVKGTEMSVYVNGLVAAKLTLDSVVSQNYGEISICANGGFNGSLSNLQYFSYGLSSFDINSVVFAGPNLTQSNGVADTTSKGKPYYLNDGWFSNKMQTS